jgi:hypothetical protein
MHQIQMIRVFAQAAKNKRDVITSSLPLLRQLPDRQ